MSTYYMFYLAKKVNDNIKVIGPAVLNDNEEFNIRPGVVRSGSFIDWEDWQEFMDYLPIEKMVNDNFTKALCTSDHSWSSEPNIQSDAYYCSYAEIARQAEKHNWGLKVGYAPLNEVDYVAENNYCVEDRYEIEFRSADMVAELQPEQRKDYGKVAFLEKNSVGYIANQIVNAFYEFSWNNEYYVVCVVG